MGLPMKNELGRQLARLWYGDHLCLTHETVAEQLTTAATFLRVGLERGERCLFVGDEGNAQAVMEALAAAGVDVLRERGRGALQAVTNLDLSRLVSGEFEPGAMVDFLRRMEAEAIADGFPGLRVAGDMTWAMGLSVPPNRLIEFEVLLDRFLRGSRAVVICQYDRSRFDPEVIYEVLLTHPVAILGDQVCPNPYYEPPELLLQRDFQISSVSKADRVDWWIAQLKLARTAEQERERAAEALRVSEERFRRAFAEAAIGMALMTPDGRFLRANAAYLAMTEYSEIEILAIGFQSVTHPGDLPEYEELIGRMLAGEIPSFVMEKRYLKKGGEVAWHRESVSLVRDRGGEPLNLIALIEDITQRRTAQEELVWYASRLRGLADASLIVNSGRSPTRVAQAVTEAAREIIGAHQAVTELTFDVTEAQAIPCVSLSEKYAAWRDHDERSDMSGLDSLVCEANRPVRMTQAELEAHPQWRGFGKEATGHLPMRGWLAAPLVGSDGQNLGLIQLSDRYEAEFTADDEAILVQLAQMASVAIEKARLYERLEAEHEHLQTLSRRLLEVQEAERRHLARELHDEVGQLLTGLRLILQPRADRPADEDKAKPEQARAIVDELLGRIGGLSFDLRPAALDQLGLLPALLALFERYTEQTGVQVHLKHRGVERRFAPELETTAYRVVQESLTNVARHAGVTEVTVRVWVTADLLSVQIEDRGLGFGPEAALASPQSSGLAGMQERVMLLAGSLAIESRLGAGTQITAELPLTESGEER
jgi:PAS domain S-box-containing protein